MNQVDEILQEILNEHRQKMQKSDEEEEEEDDIVDVLLKIQKNGDFEVPLADTNLKAVLFVSEIKSLNSDLCMQQLF